MSRPVIFHRSREMEEIMKRVTTGLSHVFGTRRPVHIVTGSGTAAMELAIRGGAGERVLSIIHGDFGERFARMAEACGRTVTRLKSELGQTVPLDVIRDALAKGDFDTVLATHSETATGVLADIPAIAAIVNERSNCLLLVDAVSSAGATQIAMDAWGLDAVVSASQKALAIPPGLGFAAVSERFLARTKSLKGRGIYLDPVRYEEFAGKSQSPTTPAISLIYALDRQMEDVELETLEARFARHRAMAERCAAWVDRAEADHLGVSLLARSNRSPSVTCIRTQERSSSVLQRMREQGFELGGGQAELTHTSFRIGHMGDHTVAGLDGMLEVLERVLRTL